MLCLSMVLLSIREVKIQVIRWLHRIISKPFPAEDTSWIIKIRFTDMMTLLPKKIDIRLQALLLMKVKARKFVSHTMAQSSIIIVIPTISFS